MQLLAHLWDELDELQGLAWHAGVALAAELRNLSRGLSRGLHTATSTAVARLFS